MSSDSYAILAYAAGGGVILGYIVHLWRTSRRLAGRERRP